MSTSKMRAFIIKFLFYAIILSMVYLIIKYAFPILTPFIIAFTIAFIFKPIIRFLRRKTKINQTFIAIVLLILFFVVFLGLMIIIIYQLYSGTRDYIIQLPEFYTQTLSPILTSLGNNAETFIKDINPEASQILDSITGAVLGAIESLISQASGAVFGYATTAATGVPIFIVQFIITIVATFFCITDYDKIVSFVFNRLPEKKRKTILQIKNKSIQVLWEYARAYAILLSITCIELFIGFLLLGIPNALPLAALISIVDILPILGVGTILIPWGLIMILTGNLPFGFAVLIMYAIITIVRQSLEPRVVGKRIGLHPFVTLICIFLGGNLFGILGIFGLPVCVTVIMQVNRSGDIKLF